MQNLPTDDPISEIVTAYRAAKRRLFLLDYDGTLREFAPTPPEAAPSAELYQLIEGLTADPSNSVVIVSGRKRDELDEWLGDLPVAFAAEHGFWRKVPGEIWQAQFNEDQAWQDAPHKLMEAAVADCAGSLIEQKSSGLVWHYRPAKDIEAAAKRGHKLAADLQAMADEQFIVKEGAMMVEIQLAGADKGAAVRFWANLPTWDFILAAGDDPTDEDMFKVLPETAFLVKVGDKPSMAKHRLSDPAAMRELLQKLRDQAELVK